MSLQFLTGIVVGSVIRDLWKLERSKIGYTKSRELDTMLRTFEQTRRVKLDFIEDSYEKPINPFNKEK